MLKVEMNKETAEILCNLNSDFYRCNAASFDQTRQAPWLGWERLAEYLGQKSLAVPGSGSPSCFSVLDVACGNLRFEDFLIDRFPQRAFSFYALDSCDELVGSKKYESPHRLRFMNMDIPMHLAQEEEITFFEQSDESSTVANQQGTAGFDLSVCFGFFHHLPLFEWREKLLRALLEHTRPGGLVAVSFWQFLNSEKMAAKARETHAEALAYLTAQDAVLGPEEFEAGDFLLGWKNIPGQYRYCHNYSDKEIEHLLETVSDAAKICALYKADGRTGNLNTYALLKVTEDS